MPDVEGSIRMATCWTLATADADGFTAAFPLTCGARPALLAPRVLETALYQGQIMKHPHCGVGLETRLSVPLNCWRQV